MGAEGALHADALRLAQAAGRLQIAGWSSPNVPDRGPGSSAGLRLPAVQDAAPDGDVVDQRALDELRDHDGAAERQAAVPLDQALGCVVLCVARLSRRRRRPSPGAAILSPLVRFIRKQA